MADIKAPEGDILDKKPLKPGETRGGARPGAGRKKGSKNNVYKFDSVKEYITPTEQLFMVKRAMKHAKTDKKVLLFLLEHVFGKAKVTDVAPRTKADPNTMSSFLDKLEKDEGKGRPKTAKQGVETEPPLYDNEQETEEDSVPSESGSAEFSGEPALEEHNTQE